VKKQALSLHSKMKRVSTGENEFPYKKDNKLEKMQGSTG